MAMTRYLMLWSLLSLPLAAQPSDWPAMPEASMRRLLYGDRGGFLDGLKSAAANGDVVAMFYLGRAYEEMEGIPHDYGASMKWYRAAAERRSGPAAWSAGRLYEMGRGTATDFAEAQRWYRRALELGFRRTALTHVYLRWFPGPEFLSLTPQPPESLLHRYEPTAEEMRLLWDAGLTGHLELRGGRSGQFGLPARVLVVMQKQVNKEVELEVPEEGTVIYVQRDDHWEKLPPGAKTVKRKLRVVPQLPERPDITLVSEEREGGGVLGGSAFGWKRSY
jgi:hypothetical protein